MIVIAAHVAAAAVVAVLERRHAVERVAVGSGIAGLDPERILEGDERRHRPVALVGAEREARRWVLREVGERDARVAVGHRLQQDRGVARRLAGLQLVEAQPGLHGVPHLVGQHHQHAGGPVGAQDLGDEAVGVPDHRVGRRAVEGLARHVGGRPHARHPAVAGVHREEPADVAPGTSERGGELGAPVLLQRGDRRGGDLGIGDGRRGDARRARRRVRLPRHHLGAAGQQQPERPARRRARGRCGACAS